MCLIVFIVKGGHFVKISQSEESQLFPTNVLFFDEDNHIYSQLRKIEGYPDPVFGLEHLTPIPLGMHVSYMGYSEKDRFGRLKYLLAEDFAKLKWPAKASQQNKAIRAYLAAIPKDYRVVLHWG